MNRWKHFKCVNVIEYINRTICQQNACEDFAMRVKDHTSACCFAAMFLKTPGSREKLVRSGNMLTLQGCIFMSISPESMANRPDTVGGDHLQGQGDGNTLVY